MKTMKTIEFARLIAVSCLCLPACNQVEPGTTGGTESTASSGPGSGSTVTETESADSASSGELPTDANFFPLSDGAAWTYRHIATDGSTFDEIIATRAVEFNGSPAFEMEDNAGANGENTIATLVVDGGQIMRVHKVVKLGGAEVMTVDYEPGFLRFDNGWGGDDAVDWMYDRTEYDGAGALSSEAVRHQIFTVESLSTSVTVPAGTFDCVQFLRQRADTGDAKRFWFADGVGKIKHEALTTGAIEELVEYQIP